MVAAFLIGGPVAVAWLVGLFFALVVFLAIFGD